MSTWSFDHAMVTRIIDGDTIGLTIDLGFSINIRGTFRLIGINAIELNQPGGKEARDNLAQLLPPGTPVTLHSVKRQIRRQASRRRLPCRRRHQHHPHQHRMGSSMERYRQSTHTHMAKDTMTGYTRKVGLRKPQPRRTYGGYDYFNAPSRMTLPIREGVGCKPEPVLTPEQADQYRRYYS